MPMSQREAKAEPFPYEASNVLLGRGGSGAVFLARTIDTHEMVAIKRQYTRSGAASGAAASSSHQRSSSIVRRIESIVEQRSLPGSNTTASAGSSSSQVPATTPAFARELQNEEDAREESNMEVMAWQREDASHALAPIQSSAGGDGRITDEEDRQTSTGSEDELQILQNVGFHPHIVRCLGDFKSARNVSYLALELMETDVAKEVNKGNVNLMQEDVCRVVMFSVLLALDFIHSKGIAHRDVKPGNLLLKVADKETSVPVPMAADGSSQASPTKAKKAYQVSLGDFSAAHSVNRIVDKCIAVNRGTLYYKAPEQLLSKEIHSYMACDMWALGCTMFEIATGTVAFFGKTELQVQLQIFHRMGSSFDAYPFQTAAPLLFDSMSVSPAFHDLLQHLLVLNPSARYTAKEALLHPFFTGLRSRYNETSSRLGRPAAMSFPMRLMSSGAKSQGKKLDLVFTAINPTARPKRKPEVRKEGPQRNQTMTRPSISPIETNRSSMVHVRSPQDSTGLREADGLNSLLSDGTSVHWSQMRSMIGDSSSFMEMSADTRPSGESPAPQRGSAGKGAAGVFSAVRRLPTRSKSQSTPIGTNDSRPTCDAQAQQLAHNNNNSSSLGRPLSGSGSESSFALPRVTFGSEAQISSIDRDRSGSAHSTSHKSEENDGATATATVPTVVAPDTPTASTADAVAAQPRPTQRGRVPVLQQPAKSTVPNVQSALDASVSGVVAAAAGRYNNAEALSRPQVPVAAYRGLFLGDDHSSARDDEERPSSSEQNSQAQLSRPGLGGVGAATAATPSSHAFKSLLFESPRPSSGGGSSTDGSSARFTGSLAANAVRPAMRPFVAPAHTVAGRTSSRHRHSGRSLPSQRHTPHLGGHDLNCETPSGRSEFMVSCCSTVTCSPTRALGSARATQSSRSETGSFFSDPTLAATAVPPQVIGMDSDKVGTTGTLVGYSQPAVPPPFPLPILLPRHANGLDGGVGTPNLPLFMPSSHNALPRPVQLSDAGPCVSSPAFAPSRTALADLTNLNTQAPPQYDLFCVSSRHRRRVSASTAGVLGSPTPRLPVASPHSLQASADRDTSKKRPREEEEEERPAPVVRT